ncbi:MAG TPA: YciI family protein [Bryobacteraceae bacterium]|jgi:hypothetical protein|nr:YciI family protein [Bryobacteraceae bacterium]
MRYMMLIYSQEKTEGLTHDDARHLQAAHWALMDEASQKGVFRGAEPLKPTSMATTMRMKDGKPLFTDGPFAETKEQLAGYYILDCENLDEAMDWAAKIPTLCKGGAGCIEIRPIQELPSRSS